MSEHTVTRQRVPTSSVGRLIHRHPVAAFLALVYGISWTLYLPSFLSRSGIGLLPFDLNVRHGSAGAGNLVTLSDRPRENSRRFS